MSIMDSWVCPMCRRGEHEGGYGHDVWSRSEPICKCTCLYNKVECKTCGEIILAVVHGPCPDHLLIANDGSLTSKTAIVGRKE